MEKRNVKKEFRLRISVHIMLFLVAVSILSFSACNRKRPKVNFYENLFTEEVMNVSDFYSFRENLVKAYSDSTDGKAYVHFHLYSIRTSADSVIRPFKYDVRIGKNYIVRANDAINQKINTKLEPQKFTTLKGDEITIGGTQDKPIMINLWFVDCPGCIAELPVLNELQKKYADKMNFIAITFEDKKQVEKFLNRKRFTFTHISNAEDYIKYIGTSPYPESIFIDKQGNIKYVEGVISGSTGSSSHFEEIIKELIFQ